MCNYTIDGGATWYTVDMDLVFDDTYECQIGDFVNGTHVEYKIHAIDDSVFHHESVTGVMSFDAQEGFVPSTTTTTTETTTNTTPPPSDYTILIIIIIAAGGAIVIIVIVIIMKKKSG